MDLSEEQVIRDLAVKCDVHPWVIQIMIWCMADVLAKQEAK